jgi:hypothetical protein
MEPDSIVWWEISAYSGKTKRHTGDKAGIGTTL